jgi:predicted secreted protein
MGGDDETDALDSNNPGSGRGVPADNEKGVTLPGIKGGTPCPACIMGWVLYTTLVAGLVTLVVMTLQSWQKYRSD